MMPRLAEGQIRVSRDLPLVYATDGSVAKRRHRGMWQTGFGWLSTHGHYGAGWTPQSLELGGVEQSTVAELRAVAHAVGELIPAGPVTVLCDSRTAGRYIEQWRAGRLVMPRGYLGSQRHESRLSILARTVAAHPGNVTVHWVRGHDGVLLNEGADALARLGCRSTRERYTADELNRRCRFLAEGFFNDPRIRDIPTSREVTNHG